MYIFSLSSLVVIHLYMYIHFINTQAKDDSEKEDSSCPPIPTSGVYFQHDNRLGEEEEDQQ